MSTNLVKKMREATAKFHSMAKNASSVQFFLGGVVNKRSYRKLLANLFFIYFAIEGEIETNESHEAIKFVDYPELCRKENLIYDLKYYYGDNWSSLIRPSVFTQFYVDRIRKISYNNPELLIAHSYAIYISDLSIDQILKNIAKNAMQLLDDLGSFFYDFDLIVDEEIFKDKYRNLLNYILLGQL